MDQSADYVVVGAGSAGCVLARRLAQSGASVILLEAGGPDRTRLVRKPGMIAIFHNVPALKKRLDWGYYTVPQAAARGRRIPQPRGCVPFKARYPGGARGRRRMQLHRGQPENTLERSRRDLDELHPPVRHYGDPADEHAARHDQVLVPFAVRPGQVTAALDPQDETGGQGHDRRRARPGPGSGGESGRDARDHGEHWSRHGHLGQPHPPQARRGDHPARRCIGSHA